MDARHGEGLHPARAMAGEVDQGNFPSEIAKKKELEALRGKTKLKRRRAGTNNKGRLENACCALANWSGTAQFLRGTRDTEEPETHPTINGCPIFLHENELHKSQTQP